MTCPLGLSTSRVGRMCGLVVIVIAGCTSGARRVVKIWQQFFGSILESAQSLHVRILSRFTLWEELQKYGLWSGIRQFDCLARARDLGPDKGLGNDVPFNHLGDAIGRVRGGDVDRQDGQL